MQILFALSVKEGVILAVKEVASFTPTGSTHGHEGAEMKTFTWVNGRVGEGLSLTDDERLGRVVCLGEAGRGRRYEKVALSRKVPAEVVNGCVREAHPVKITLPPRDEKPEKSFYVLEKARSNEVKVLVRINTHTSYVRGASGRYEGVGGDPETLIAGHGAFGAAGRVGTWSDGLVVMRSGDVLRVYPSREIAGTSSYALWLEDGKPVTTSWQDYENLQAVEAAQGAIEMDGGNPEGLDIVFGTMSTFTYEGRGVIRDGLDVDRGVTGSVVSLGQIGRGRKLAEVPIVGFEPGERFGSAAVAVLSEEERPGRYGDQSKIGRIYGLVKAKAPEDAILVRTQLPHATRTFGSMRSLRGEPTLIARGIVAGGAAGRADSAEDSLWVLRPGEAIVTEMRGRYAFADEVIESRNGELVITPWWRWELADAKVNPEAYIAKGKAPCAHVPAGWVGRVVQVFCRVKEYNSRKREYYFVQQQTHEGELISVSPLVVNLGWNGRDRKDVTVDGDVLWVTLDPHKVVVRPDESEVQEREEIKAEAATLQATALELREQPHFSCFQPELRGWIGRVASGDGTFGGSIDFSLATTEEILGWIESATSGISAAREAESAARDLHRQVEAGEVLFEWGGRCTGDEKFFVVVADGTLRDPDDSQRVDRHKSYNGSYVRWDLVGSDELALTWVRGGRRASADTGTFTVAKLPVGGLTHEQLETVARIETDDIGASQGAFGLDPTLAATSAINVEEVKRALSGVVAKFPDFTWEQLAADGLDLIGGSKVANFGDWNIASRLVQERVDRARVTGELSRKLDSIVVAHGSLGSNVLEVTAYYWGGEVNLRVDLLPQMSAEIAAVLRPVLDGDREVFVQRGDLDDGFQIDELLDPDHGLWGRVEYDDDGGMYFDLEVAGFGNVQILSANHLPDGRWLELFSFGTADDLGQPMLALAIRTVDEPSLDYSSTLQGLLDR